jgi:hypothetical protein
MRIKSAERSSICSGFNSTWCTHPSIIIPRRCRLSPRPCPFQRLQCMAATFLQPVPLAPAAPAPAKPAAGSEISEHRRVCRQPIPLATLDANLFFLGHGDASSHRDSSTNRWPCRDGKKRDYGAGTSVEKCYLINVFLCRENSSWERLAVHRSYTTLHHCFLPRTHYHSSNVMYTYF